MSLLTSRWLCSCHQVPCLTVKPAAPVPCSLASAPAAVPGHSDIEVQRREAGASGNTSHSLPCHKGASQGIKAVTEGQHFQACTESIWNCRFRCCQQSCRAEDSQSMLHGRFSGRFNF